MVSNNFYLETPSFLSHFRCTILKEKQICHFCFCICLSPSLKHLWSRTVRDVTTHICYSSQEERNSPVIIIITQPWRGYFVLTNAEATFVVVEEVQLCKQDWIWGIHTLERIKWEMNLEISLSFTLLTFYILLYLHVSCQHTTVMQKTQPYIHTRKHKIATLKTQRHLAELLV